MACVPFLMIKIWVTISVEFHKYWSVTCTIFEMEDITLRQNLGWTTASSIRPVWECERRGQVEAEKDILYELNCETFHAGAGCRA